MQAIHCAERGDVNVLKLTTLPYPELQSPYDIVVKIKGASINPVDLKVREGVYGHGHEVLGFDASGIVDKAGDSALFKKGDEVMYAGAMGRQGNGAQYAVVDSRIVGYKPKSAEWADAAGFPLVSLTAWEMLEDHFGLKPMQKPDREHTLLIINGAGGVGSIAAQLAAKIFHVKNIVSTASRPETIEWVKKNGATHVINHHEELGPQLKELGLTPTLAFICFGVDSYLGKLPQLMAPFSHIGSITGAKQPLEINGPDAFTRAISFHWEYMFSKAHFGYNMESQGRILNQVGQFVDAGLLKSVATKTNVLSVETLKEGHRTLESGKAIGKIVYEVHCTIE